MLEYAMIVALLSVVVIAGVTSIGNETRITFDKVTEEMGKAGVTEDKGL